jgi:hypothetical protein
MSLATVTDDYVKERFMLEAWRNRMDIPTEVTDIPPESQMSFSYRQGWKTYLAQILQISNRMIEMCAQATNSGNTTALQNTLQTEAGKYDQLAAEAAKLGLTELQAMLAWEAESRRDVAADLP